MAGQVQYISVTVIGLYGVKRRMVLTWERLMRERGERIWLTLGTPRRGARS
jgi:hypothetical protein